MRNEEQERIGLTRLGGFREPPRERGPDEDVLFRDLVDLPSTTFGAFALYRYPAKFIPHVVSHVLEKYASRGMTIFDPFAGYGTVGVVSRLYGYDYELWDLNPLLEILHDISNLEPQEVNVRELVNSVIESEVEFKPDWSNFDYWFHPTFRPLLKRAWGFYHSIEDERVRLLLTIPLLKTSRQFSFDDIGRMKLSKSPRSKKRIEDFLSGDWKSRFRRMLECRLSTVLKRLHEHQELGPNDVTATVYGGVDSFSKSLEDDRDILITSPPYLQSQEYIRQAKMDLYWLGHSESEMKRLSRLEIPYRAVGEVDINSETYSRMRGDISEEKMRTVFDRYFWGVGGAFTRLQEQITNRMFIFVGRSSLRGTPIPLDRIFAEHLVSLGWIHEKTLVDTIVSRSMFSYEVNPATRIVDSRTATEHLVILKRP
ncbi:MAG: hypothetical protein DRO87_09110 [Candidatus Thorarchaeota archaeon]|nr:MAG: hypothetical protein DRO87_09110 [Candidatus Thorarchaeota archaeon]RLI55746.1 MAG: hypothetical protein DRP09_08880 [Candidatus Thorarchaeota archaeon]